MTDEISEVFNFFPCRNFPETWDWADKIVAIRTCFIDTGSNNLYLYFKDGITASQLNEYSLEDVIVDTVSGTGHVWTTSGKDQSGHTCVVYVPPPREPHS